MNPKNKLSFDEVKYEFDKRGYSILSQDYVDSLTKLLYICNAHPDTQQSISVNSLKSGRGCLHCGRAKRAKSISGVNHHNWKGGVSKEVRSDINNTKWRLKVFARDKFTCVRCGQVGGDLNAHHILAYAEYDDLRLEVENGVTLCFECHRSKYYNSFHTTYGLSDNTLEQFLEFMSTTKNKA